MNIRRPNITGIVNGIDADGKGGVTRAGAGVGRRDRRVAPRPRLAGESGALAAGDPFGSRTDADRGTLSSTSVELLDVILGYDCNLHCDYCTITPAMRRRALEPTAVVKELRHGRERGCSRVSFTGGEPTIRGDLLALVREARALGYDDVKVQSNGLLFATASNVARLVDAGATRLHVSIHTHRPDRYDALVRRAGSYALMASGLENAVRSGAHTVADVILKEDTYRDLPDAIEWLHQRGVPEVHLWFVSLTDQNRENFDSMPRMTEVVPAMRIAFASGRRLGMEVRSLHVPRCLLGTSFVSHAYDPGAEDVRVVTPEAVFDLRASKISPTVKVAACRGCEHDARCPGVRPDYLERYGDAEIASARGVAPSRAPTRLPTLG
jgi:MoaA/NifB/PqqE/SkfB family radical SAM enzyme